MAFSLQLLTQTGKRQETVFSSRSCIGGQQWPTQGISRRPCSLHTLGAPTHLPLSRPFC